LCGAVTLGRVVAAAVDAYLAFKIESYITETLWWVLLGVKVFALGDSAIRKDEFFVAAEKQNKVFWLLLLGVFLTLHLLPGFKSSVFFNMIGTVAALVYLIDVRPTLRAMHQR